MKLGAQALGTDGDAVPITVMAHEMGHAVQRMLGILHQTIMSAFEEEQSADCLAGVLLAALGRKGMLEPGDLEEAAWTLATLDDRQLRGHLTVIKDQIFHMTPGAHGSAAERRAALMRGYQSGIPACLGR
jgi:predicted metalloprotease